MLNKLHIFPQVFVLDCKLFNLQLVDDNFKKLGLRQIDGEKPSKVSEISLSSNDSSLHQHGK